MDIHKLYTDFGISFLTEGHKHCSPGWVHTPCPLCTGSPGYHMGYNTMIDRFICWRCGSHNSAHVVQSLLNVSYQEAYKILKDYGVFIGKAPETQPKKGKKQFILPSNTTGLQKHHKKYISKRDFDPDKLEKEWGIQGTGVISKIGNLSYKHRILIPYYWDKKVVSFDTRDITNKHQNKYQACPLEYEEIEHKHILYGRQEKWGTTGICVEGTTDVWRLGFNSFATSGIKYTSKQMRIIAKTFKRVPIIFDDEPQAQKQAIKLSSDLKFRGVDSFVVKIVGDPGGMEQSEADYLVKQLI